MRRRRGVRDNPKVTVALLAKRIAEDRQREERLRLAQRLRRLTAFSCVVLALLGAAIWFLAVSRPSIDASLDGVGPNPQGTVLLSELASGKSPFLIAHLDSISLSPDYEREFGSAASQDVEVVLPLPEPQCRLAATDIGGTCGPTSQPTPMRNLSFDFSRTVLASISVEAARTLSVRGPQIALPSAHPLIWTLDVGAPAILLRLRCFDGSTVTVLGTRVPLERTRCADGASEWRIRGTFAITPELVFAGVRTIELEAEAGSVKTSVDDALLRIGDTHTPVTGRRGTAVSLKAEEPGGIGLDLRTSSAPARSSMTVYSARAASVVEAKAERVPNLLSRYRELWFALIFLVLALLVALWSDAFILWR
jgi:hypothetical protein